jgi:hypothetical protein
MGMRIYHKTTVDQLRPAFDAPQAKALMKPNGREIKANTIIFHHQHHAFPMPDQLYRNLGCVGVFDHIVE